MAAGGKDGDLQGNDTSQEPPEWNAETHPEAAESNQGIEPAPPSSLPAARPYGGGGIGTPPSLPPGIDDVPRNHAQTPEDHGGLGGPRLEADGRSVASSSTPLNLSIDTNIAGSQHGSKSRSSSRSPLAPSPETDDATPQLRSTGPSLVSPRTRPRGFSLRRSILARGLQGQMSSNPSSIELQPIEASSSSGRRHAAGDTTPQSGKKGDTTITITPLDSNGESGSLQSRPTKQKIRDHALPHYDRWVTNNARRFRIPKPVTDFRERVRKRILQIHDIPPSKDGRHIDLDVARRKPLTDERTGHEYVDNTIRSCRYTLWSFLPRQLFAQFSKLANFYFLCVSILQMIPGLSTTGNYTTIVPLSFFVSISMAKEGYDDFRRYKQDKAENIRIATVLEYSRSNQESARASSDSASASGGKAKWVRKEWRNVRVGEIVKLVRGETSPADLAILHSSGANGIAYFETMALDGETNLKSKQASSPLAKACAALKDLEECKAHFVVEDPNLNLYNFDGKVSVGEETLPLTNVEIVYRGSILRNTPETIGMVVYTGDECKIRMNATKNPRIKAPTLQFVVNKVVIIIVCFVIALAIFNTVAYQIWVESTEEKSWYLDDANVAFFPILTSFIILFNTMIPLSLYVSLEIVKVFQLVFMNDIDMYDEASNTPMEARTSTINEELGQVSCIFSDKTGTLTNNSMLFRKMSVAGTAWLHENDLHEIPLPKSTQETQSQRKRSKGKKPMRQSHFGSPPRASVRDATNPFPTESSTPSVARNGSRWKSSAKPHGSQDVAPTAQMINYIQRRPDTLFAQRVRLFLLSMALCHTALPESNDKGKLDFQAASPDEHALVQAAYELGYMMVDRQSSTITIANPAPGSQCPPPSEIYQVLDVIEFSSVRKRMSIVVRMPDHRISLFCKGADTTIVSLLRKSDLAIDQATKVERKTSIRKSLEAREAIRRLSEHRSPIESMTRGSFNIPRHSLGGLARPSMTVSRLQPIRDQLDQWLHDRERDVDLSLQDNASIYYSPRPSGYFGVRPSLADLSSSSSLLDESPNEIVEEAMVANDEAVFERCFQHIDDFATEGLRTLLYAQRFIDEEEYKRWKKLYADASTSLVDRQAKMERTGEMIEKDLDLVGATAIEDKLQDGVPEVIDKLRRAQIKMWMLTGDKRETAINIGHSCRLIKDYSAITILDHETGDFVPRIAAATLEISRGQAAHSVVVIDGQTLGMIEADETVKKLFIDLAVLVDSVICCRASPSQKASLVHAIRKHVKNAVTLAIGDGANDIAMIQEAHVGIGITGKEGLQAARTSDYSIAQFRFLLKLLLVHGRWNYIRTCRYTLGTFWKEMLFYLTQALYQRWAGYTGTSLYESWSLSMFNTLFTSLPVIFMGIFEKDLSPSTLLAIPELYTQGHNNGGFNLIVYLAWVFMASADAMVVFFIMLGIYGQAIFTVDNSLYPLGDLTFTACIIIINTKIQFLELHNKSITCAIAMFISIGGWFLWNIILSFTYADNKIYDVKDGLLQRWGRNSLWWLVLIVIVVAVWAWEVAVKVFKRSWLATDADVFRELEKDEGVRRRFEEGARLGLGPSRAEKDSPEQQEIEQNSQERTEEENEEREREVQEILDKPRTSTGAAVRRRQRSEPDASYVQQEPETNDHNSDAKNIYTETNNDDDDDNGKGKAKTIDGGKSPTSATTKRRSLDVQEMLRRGFGSVRRSFDA